MIQGDVKMRDMHAALKQYLIERGWEVEPEVDEEHHEEGHAKKRYEKIQEKERAATEKLREAEQIKAEAAKELEDARRIRKSAEEERENARDEGYKNGYTAGLVKANSDIEEQRNTLARQIRETELARENAEEEKTKYLKARHFYEEGVEKVRTQTALARQATNEAEEAKRELIMQANNLPKTGEVKSMLSELLTEKLPALFPDFLQKVARNNSGKLLETFKSYATMRLGSDWEEKAMLPENSHKKATENVQKSIRQLEQQVAAMEANTGANTWEMEL